MPIKGTEEFRLNDFGNPILLRLEEILEWILDNIGDQGSRIVWDSLNNRTTIYGGDDADIPLLHFENDLAGLVNMLHPSDYGGGSPAFSGGNKGFSRGNWNARNFTLVEDDDPSDFGWRTLTIRDKTDFGLFLTNQWNQLYGQDGGLLITRKTASPHHIGGSPNFIGYYHTNLSAWPTGKYWHLYFQEPSGTNPTLNMNSWGARALKRADGSAPPVAFWDQVEVTFIDNGTELRADTESNSDRTEGREDDRSNKGPMTQRGFRDSVILVAEPTSNNRGIGAWVRNVTRWGEAYERPVQWDHNLGWTVLGGWGTYESGIDSFGETLNKAWPRKLRVSSVNGAWVNDDTPDYSWDVQTPGPQKPRKTFGIAQANIITPDSGRGVAALSLLKAGALDSGLTIEHDWTNSLMKVNALTRGTGSAIVNIAGGDTGGAGKNATHGWMRIETTADHNCAEYDLVFVTSTPGGVADGVWTTIKYDARRVVLVGCPSAAMAAGGTLRRVSRDALLTFDLANRRTAIRGTASNDAAAAGDVGEVLTAERTEGAASLLTTDTPANTITLSLTPGNWWISANNSFGLAAATVVTRARVSISTTSATQDTSQFRYHQRAFPAGFVPGNQFSVEVNPFRLAVAATTTIYLVATLNFSADAASTFGVISALRIR